MAGLGRTRKDPTAGCLYPVEHEPGVRPQNLEQTVDRAQKEKVVEELGQIFESSGVVVVAHYAGLTVAEMQDLRARMRDEGGSVRVAKNRLAKIALEGTDVAGITEFLSGMTVLSYSEDPVAAAKVAEDYAKANDYDAVFIMKDSMLIYLAEAANLTDQVVLLYDQRFPPE